MKTELASNIDGYQLQLLFFARELDGTGLIFKVLKCQWKVWSRFYHISSFTGKKLY